METKNQVLSALGTVALSVVCSAYVILGAHWSILIWGLLITFVALAVINYAIDRIFRLVPPKRKPLREVYRECLERQQAEKKGEQGTYEK